MQGVTGTLDQNRTHNRVNEITSISTTTGETWPTPGYDANDNTTSFPQPNELSASYDATWDAWNRLVMLEDGGETVAAYQYDRLGRRIIQKMSRPGMRDQIPQHRGSQYVLVAIGFDSVGPQQ